MYESKHKFAVRGKYLKNYDQIHNVVYHGIMFEQIRWNLYMETVLICNVAWVYKIIFTDDFKWHKYFELPIEKDFQAQMR